jgi:hypothetical protein
MNELNYLYELLDLRDMMREKAPARNAHPGQFAGVLLRASERLIVARFFWTERKHGRGCSRRDLERMASRYH